MQPTIVCEFDGTCREFLTDRLRPDARGHYTIGKEMVDSVIDRIRRIAGTYRYSQPSS